MPRPRPTPAAHALRAALLLFWEKGYGGTSLADLVAHTGLSRSSLYAEFGSKEGLFAAALDLYLDEVVDSVLGPLQAAEADLSAIRGMLHGLAALHDQAPASYGCLLAHTGSERGRLDDAVSERVHAHQGRMERAYRNALSNAAARGQLRDGVAIDATATALTVFTRGLTTQIRAGASEASLRTAIDATLSLLEAPCAP